MERTNFSNKRILLHVDYNTIIRSKTEKKIKIDKTDKIIDKKILKIDKTVKTINYILSFENVHLAIATHFGRPTHRGEFELNDHFEYLKNKIIGLKKTTIKDYSEEKVVFLDNIRYYKEEELSDFSKKFDLIVLEAFGLIHRKFPWCENVLKIEGFLMTEEKSFLNSYREILKKGKSAVIVGGNKVDEKIKLLEKFSECKIIAVGLIGKYISLNKRNNVIIPKDFIILEKNRRIIIDNSKIKKSDNVVDVGPETLKNILSETIECESILMNGTFGVIDDPDNSTKKFLRMVDKSKVVIGGGETANYAINITSEDDYMHVSTGGGAMLSILLD